SLYLSNLWKAGLGALEMVKPVMGLDPLGHLSLFNKATAGLAWLDPQMNPDALLVSPCQNDLAVVEAARKIIGNGKVDLRLKGLARFQGLLVRRHLDGLLGAGKGLRLQGELTLFLGAIGNLQLVMK